MPGHDQTNRREPQSRAWFGIILVVSATLVAFRPVYGQGDPDGTDDVPRPSRSSIPIDLAARRVRVWTQAGHQWVLLSGQAAVLQGSEGRPRRRDRLCPDQAR